MMCNASVESELSEYWKQSAEGAIDKQLLKKQKPSQLKVEDLSLSGFKEPPSMA